MNVLDRILGRREEAVHENEPAEIKEARENGTAPAPMSGIGRLKNLAEYAARELIMMEREGRLRYDMNEYAESADFTKLLGEFDAKAAVRIYEAERAVSEAYQAGRDDAVDEIYRRREMPRSMRSGTAQASDVDYARMSSEEFARLRDRLQRG